MLFRSYRRVIESLSNRLSGQTREEIARSSHLDGGVLTKILNNLAACDFIRVYSSPQKKERGRIYQLTDMFSLFHLRFIQEDDGQDPHYWTSSGRSGQKNAWAGYAFEQVCLHHIPQIKKSLGISGILSNSYAWSCKAFTDEDGTEWKGGQIDLVIDRNDQVMNLCEMKYAQDSFVITKEYAEILRYRASLFHKVIKTKKDLKCTFITPFGVRMNMYSDIVAHQIVLEDLFS